MKKAIQCHLPVILLEDDGIDDFFIANASVKLTNGNFNYYPIPVIFQQVL